MIRLTVGKIGIGWNGDIFYLVRIGYHNFFFESIDHYRSREVDPFERKIVYS